MGSSCGKEIKISDAIVPEAIVEMKKQRQFTEHWKRKYDVTLTCSFTTVNRMCGRPVPGLRGCAGVILVKITVTCKQPSRTNLNSVLHTPVLQWHGLDIKFQFPKYLPLNLWEGEHTIFAVYKDDSVDLFQGYCTVTAKIGQEQILLEEKLKSENTVPLTDVKNLSNEFEKHLEKLPVSVKKKHKQSGGRSSQRESRDTGYTSEKNPYPTLGYGEIDTDSDHEEEKREKERRLKMRRKDTPACLKRPHVTGSPKTSYIPLIEELEMGTESASEHSEEDKTSKFANTTAKGELIEEKVRKRSAIRSHSATMRQSQPFDGSPDTALKSPTRDITDGTGVRSANSAPTNLRTSSKRKKKSITLRFSKEKTMSDGLEQADDVDDSLRKCSSADDADDEADHTTEAKDKQGKSDQEMHSDGLSMQRTSIEQNALQDELEGQNKRLQKENSTMKQQLEEAGREIHDDEQQVRTNNYQDKADPEKREEDARKDIATNEKQLERVAKTPNVQTQIEQDIGDSLNIHDERDSEQNELSRQDTKSNVDSEMAEINPVMTKQKNDLKDDDDSVYVGTLADYHTSKAERVVKFSFQSRATSVDNTPEKEDVFNKTTIMSDEFVTPKDSCFDSNKQPEAVNAGAAKKTRHAVQTEAHATLKERHVGQSSQLDGSHVEQSSKLDGSHVEQSSQLGDIHVGQRSQLDESHMRQSSQLDESCLGQSNQLRGKADSFSSNTRRVPSPLKHSKSSDMGSGKKVKPPEVIPPLSPKMGFLNES